MNKMPGLFLYNERMLQVMAYYKSSGVTQRDFLESIQFVDKNLYQVKNGLTSFKIYHLDNCIRLYKINPGYFFKKRAKMFS